ncbi:hypothetical protein, partial [Shigella flexneri]|uniref:hypothetical protein n=2 Tax=Shigella flexneri TaxID=623 RepID=UPI0019D42FCA
MNIYIFIKMKISGDDEMWKRRGASHFFGLLRKEDKKTGFPRFQSDDEVIYSTMRAKGNSHWRLPAPLTLT